MAEQKDRGSNPRRAGNDDGDAEAEPVRCGCGALLARRTPQGIELRCRRCKRAVLLRLEEGDGPGEQQAGEAVTLTWGITHELPAFADPPDGKVR